MFINYLCSRSQKVDSLKWMEVIHRFFLDSTEAFPGHFLGIVICTNFLCGARVWPIVKVDVSN